MNNIRKLLLVRKDPPNDNVFVVMVEAGNHTLSNQLSERLAQEVIDVVVDKLAELKVSGRLRG